MSWASEFPEELLCRPTGLVLLSGLDTVNNPVHQSVWDAFSSNRKVDRVPLKFKLHGDEYPKTKPKRPTYDWYIPKGILKTNWMKKHLEIIPSLVVLFFDYDWNDPMWKDKQMECVEKIKAARECLAGRSTKVCILLMQTGIPLPPGEDVVATERASSLCSACELSNKHVFVLPVTEHLLGYTIRLEHVFADLSKAYYHSEVRKIKSHKDFLNKTTHALLFVRHQFKIAFYNELKSDYTTALKHYKQAYSYIMELRLLDSNLLEIKTVAGFISYKICKISFNAKNPLDAISQFRKHIDSFKGKVGISELAFEHSAWMSKQFQVFGDIFDEAIKLGQGAVSTQHPGIYYQQAAYHATSRRSLTQVICQSESTQVDNGLIEGLKNLDYYGQRPWRQGHQSIEPPEPTKEKDGILGLQALEKQIDYSKIIIPLLCNAIAQTKKYKSPRMKRYLTVQLMEENYAANEFERALLLLTRVTWEYRVERWWNILTSILTLALKCAYLACNVREYVAGAIELVGVYGLQSREAKEALQDNLNNIFEGLPPNEIIEDKRDQSEAAKVNWKNLLDSKDKKDFIIDMSNIFSFIECKVKFVQECFQADDVIQLCVYIRSTAPKIIKLKKLYLKFKNDSYNDLCILKSKKPSNKTAQSEKVGGANPNKSTNEEKDCSSDDQSEDIDEELTLEPGKVVRASFKFVPMICDVGGSIEVTSLFLALGRPDEDGDDDDDTSMGDKPPKPEFTLRWNRSNLDVIPPNTSFQKNFFPEVSRKAEAFWQTIKPFPHVKVQPRKFRLKLDIVHDSPGFVGEMLKFKVSIVNQEVHRVINVRCNVMLDPNVAPEIKNSTTFYTASNQKEADVSKEVKLLPSHPIYIELAEKLEKGDRVEGCFYTQTSLRGKLAITISVCYDIAIAILDSGTECRCIENHLVAVKILDPLDVSVDLLSTKIEPLDYHVNVEQSFLALATLKNLVNSPIEIVDTRVELRDQVLLEDGDESSILVGELLNKKEEAKETFCLSLKPSDVHLPGHHTVALGKYFVYMRRTDPSSQADAETSSFVSPSDLHLSSSSSSPPKNFKYSKIFCKVVDLPPVTMSLQPLMVRMTLPAFGVVHTPMVVSYTIANKSHVVQEILVMLESSEGFMFSGHKQIRVRILPYSEDRLTYSFVPLTPGTINLPKLKIKNERFPDMEFETPVEKLLQSSVFVKPKDRTIKD